MPHNAFKYRQVGIMGLWAPHWGLYDSLYVPWDLAHDLDDEKLSVFQVMMRYEITAMFGLFAYNCIDTPPHSLTITNSENGLILR